uniref:Uncharacterized protein n=1 Tax=Rhizophora mucronata TaxID=61149 RepID=A0A2P2R0L4_RHIMU
MEPISTPCSPRYGNKGFETPKSRENEVNPTEF